MFVLSMTVGASAAPRTSDPAFLGIGMFDSSGQTRCQITKITRGSGAEAANLHVRDTIQTIDGVVIPNCDRLLETITRREAGDVVAIEVIRDGQRFTAHPQLGSRTEILRRQLVGHPLTADLVNAESASALDLSALKGKAAIVGWFMPSCEDCKQVFGALARWTRKQSAPLAAYAVTYSNTGEPIKAVRERFRLDVPLAVSPNGPSADGTDTGDIDMSIIFGDTNRIVFMVIDCHGVVSYVAPVAPNGEDLDASLDELFVAADHARIRR